MTNVVLQGGEKDVTALADALIKIANAQYTQDEWSINGAAFIIVAVSGFLVFGGVFGLLIRSVLMQQRQMVQKFLTSTDLLSKFQESFDKNTKILEQVSAFLKELEVANQENAKRETTRDQLHCITKELLNSYKFKLAVEVQRIIDVNNISDREKTKSKIEILLKNLYQRYIQNFNNFQYQGNKVGELIKDNNWRVSQYGLIYDYIYMENRDLNKFYNDLDIMFGTIFNEIRNKVDF